MPLETTALRCAGLDGDHAATKARSGIFEMTQQAEEAVLRPKQTGRWSHALRAALAARIAHLNDEPMLAATYLSAAGEFAPLAHPLETGAAHDLCAVTAFMDKVAMETADANAADITDLQEAGIADADIVRLAELNAFVSYQVRVIAGLRLIAGGAA